MQCHCSVLLYLEVIMPGAWSGQLGQINNNPKKELGRIVELTVNTHIALEICKLKVSVFFSSYEVQYCKRRKN